MARPRMDRKAIVAEIVERLSKGEPLAKICRDEGMPSDQAVRTWMKEDESVSFAIAGAREAGFDQIAMECLMIADEQSDDFIPTDKGAIFNPEAVMRSKVRIETRLKLLAKWDPKRYGEKMEVANSGTIVHQHVITDERRAEIQRKLRESNERLIEMGKS